MFDEQTFVRSEVLSLVRFVADTRAARRQAWNSVERLKLACALESVCAPMLQCELDDLARIMRDVRSELGRSFDDSDLATWLSSPNVWLENCPPADLLGSDAASVLAAARTERFVVEG